MVEGAHWEKSVAKATNYYMVDNRGRRECVYIDSEKRGSSFKSGKGTRTPIPKRGIMRVVREVDVSSSVEERVGKEEGEEEGKQVEQRSHQSKERHKGSRANHSRRALADRKRDSGMIGPPSRF